LASPCADWSMSCGNGGSVPGSALPPDAGVAGGCRLWSWTTRFWPSRVGSDADADEWSLDSLAMDRVPSSVVDSSGKRRAVRAAPDRAIGHALPGDAAPNRFLSHADDCIQPPGDRR